MDWRDLRDRWLRGAARRRMLARLPVGRTIADHHARALFDVVAGFVQTQMLRAALALGVFEALRDGPASWDGLVDLPPAGAAALRQALEASGLIESRGELVGLTVAGLVVATEPGLRVMIEHNDLLYADLADPVGLLRGGEASRIAALWPYAGAGASDDYSRLMTASLDLVVEDVIASGVLRGAAHIMDVGGGTGGFLRAVGAHYPGVRLTLVDLPDVVRHVDPTETSVAVLGVDRDSPLPNGADTITLIRILHDLDDRQALALLRRVAAALPPGGRVVLAEPVASRGRDPQTAYFAAYFAAMRSGRLRSSDEIRGLMQRAGLTPRTERRASYHLDIVVASN